MYRVAYVDGAVIVRDGMVATVPPTLVPSPFFTSLTAITTTTDWPSNTGWHVSSSGDFDTTTYKLLNAVDRIDVANSWYTNRGKFATTGTPRAVIEPAPWIQIQFPSAYRIGSYFIRSPQGLNVPETWEVHGSNDNVTFTTVQSYSATGFTWAINTNYTFQVTNAHDAYQYWRLVFTSKTTQTGFDWVGLAMLRFNVISP